MNQENRQHPDLAIIYGKNAGLSRECRTHPVSRVADFIRVLVVRGIGSGSLSRRHHELLRRPAYRGRKQGESDHRLRQANGVVTALAHHGNIR